MWLKYNSPVTCIHLPIQQNLVVTRVKKVVNTLSFTTTQGDNEKKSCLQRRRSKQARQLDFRITAHHRKNPK